MEKQYTKMLAEFVTNLKFSDLDEATVNMTKFCVFDWLGVTIRGSYEKPSAIIRELMQTQLPANEDATILCDKPFKTSALYAALINGAASHALDMDDVHKTSQTHLAVPVISAALAAAEQLGSSGEELITAIVAGYDVMARVAESVVPESYEFWHVTSTAGSFGAAAATGKLMNLDEQRMVYALGSAGTQSAGLFEFLRDGANSKVLHAGKAAFNGLFSSELSARGFTAAHKILEGDKGFCKAMVQEPHWDRLDRKLGSHFIINDNSFKPYACCRWAHPAITVALLMREEHGIDPTKIKSITIEAFPNGLKVVDNDDPKTIYGCKFSIQYCVAAALYFGKVGVDQFTEELMSHPELRKLMAITTTVPKTFEDPDRGPDGPVIKGARIIIHMEDGSEYVKLNLYPLGDPENPMSFADMKEKFLTLNEPVYAKAWLDGLLDFVGNLEKVPDLSKALGFLSR